MILPLILAVHMASPKLIWQAKISGYRFEKWKFPEEPTDDDNDYQAIRLSDVRGRLITEIHNFRVDMFGLSWDKAPRKLKDLNGDGAPEAVFFSWSGGAHGSMNYYVWSLGKSPRCLLAYDKNNVSDEHDFDLVDLDHDGYPEIRSWYDGFYYRDKGPEGHSLRSGPLPIVLKYSGNRFVDETRRFRSFIKPALVDIWDNFDTDMSENGFGDARNVQHLEAISLIGLGYEYGIEAAIWRSLKSKVGPREYAWCWRSRWVIWQIVADRLRRYTYPAVGEKIRARYGEPCKPLPPIRVTSSGWKDLKPSNEK